MAGLDILFLLAVVFVFFKLSSGFDQQNNDEGLGSRPGALLSTYQASDEMLLYIDEAAKFAAYEATVMTFEQGGLIKSDCSSYAGYKLWTSGTKNCYPQGTVLERAFAQSLRQ